jgi:dihydrofolate reductase
MATRSIPQLLQLMPTPRISVFLALSLDGYIARTDGSLDWLQSVEDPTGQQDYGYASFLASIDAVVLGRNTYETMLAFTPWPLTGKRVIVLTHHPLEPAHGETVLSGQLAPLFAQLGQEGVRRVYLDGGQTICQGLREDRIDDMTLSWIPILLGSGRPLFASLPESAWQLQQCQSFPRGLVQATYRRTRTVAT